MAKTWVLDTETKGTGAHIAPLKHDRGAESEALSLVHFHPAASPAGAEETSPQTRSPLFKVVDVFSAGVLAENVDAAAAVRALSGRRTATDARVYVRGDEDGRWRLLNLGDTRALWALARRTTGG
jgi:hypothetical protein